MNRGLPIGALLLACFSHAAHAAEGPVSSLKSASSTEARVSNYIESRAGHAAVGAPKELQSRQGETHTSPDAKASNNKKQRATNTAKSARADHFYFYDAATLLITDRDEDGFFSEFRVRFDVDSNLGDALVYAQLYLRRLGTTDWALYHETDDFWLDGQSNSDDYYVTTVLDEGFATAEYEVLIDLYEVGYSGIAATIGPYDSGALSYLPLEEVDLDLPIELPGYDIEEVFTTLLIDDDDDGHYSQFRIELDPNANVGGNLLYAKVWVRAEGGTWIEEHTSEDFLVDAGGDADVYVFTVDWISGYPTAFYDVQIDLYESASGLLVASAGSERPELAQIPLEDQSRDVRPNPPSTGNGGNAVSHESGGGGAMGVMWMCLLLAVAGTRVTG